MSEIISKLKTQIKALAQIAHEHVWVVSRCAETTLGKDLTYNINKHYRLFISTEMEVRFLLCDIKESAIQKLNNQKKRASLIFLSRVLKMRLPRDLAFIIASYQVTKPSWNVCYRTIYDCKKCPKGMF